MALSAALEQAISRAGDTVAGDLTLELQKRAREAGIDRDAAAGLWVTYVGDGRFVCGSDSDEFDRAEYGDDGRPPLGLLRRFEYQLPKMGSERLDRAVADELRGVL